MGLKDLYDEPEYPVGSVSSRMKPKNISMPEEWWRSMAIHNPWMFDWYARDMNREQVKLFVELLDDVIEDRMEGEKIADQQKEQAEEVRESLVEHL